MRIEEINALKPYDYIKHSKLGVCIVHKFIQDLGLVLQPINTANFILEHSKDQVLHKLSQSSKWRYKNIEKAKTTRDAYKQKHKEEIKENSRKYYHDNKEKVKAYYIENRKAIIKQNIAYYKEHTKEKRAKKEELKAKREELNQDPEYVKKQILIRKIRSAAWYQKNKEELKQKRTLYNQENREEVGRIQKERNIKKK